jgi:ribonuclease inhibitor
MPLADRDEFFGRRSPGRGHERTGKSCTMNYTIDLNGIASRDALHEQLAKVFSFPEYYGRNWDAFDECIGEVKLPATVKVIGFEDFRFRLAREAKLLADCLRYAVERCPQGEFNVEGLP